MAYNIIRDKKNQGKYSYIIIGVLLFFTLVLFVNLFKLFGQLIKTQQILQKQLQQEQALASENQNLKYLLKKKQTESYLEEKARELSLAKKNELIFIPNQITNTPAPKEAGKPAKNLFWEWLQKIFKHQ